MASKQRFIKTFISTATESLTRPIKRELEKRKTSSAFAFRHASKKKISRNSPDLFWNKEEVFRGIYGLIFSVTPRRASKPLRVKKAN